MINCSVIGCQVKLKIVEGGPGSRRDVKSAGNPIDFFLPGGEKITKNIHCRPRRPSSSIHLNTIEVAQRALRKWAQAFVFP
jgi:hypothetical protein